MKKGKFEELLGMKKCNEWLFEELKRLLKKMENDDRVKELKKYYENAGDEYKRLFDNCFAQIDYVDDVKYRYELADDMVTDVLGMKNMDDDYDFQKYALHKQPYEICGTPEYKECQNDYCGNVHLYKFVLKSRKERLSKESRVLRKKKDVVRQIHRNRWRKYKAIIAPGSEIHHEWILGTADYRGAALVEADPHHHGIINVIQILEGEITLVREL